MTTQTSASETGDVAQSLLHEPRHLIIQKRALVLARTGLSQATMYRAIASGNFPKPRQLSAHSVGWIASEVDQWLTERVASVIESPIAKVAQ